MAFLFFFFAKFTMNIMRKILYIMEVFNMFNKKFKIVEIRKNGVTITHYLNGKKKEVNKDIEAFKGISSKYEMIGKEGMVIWVE